MKIVINKCYGGFGLSEKAMRRFAELEGVSFEVSDKYSFPTFLLDGESFSEYEVKRDDPNLVQVVEELGKEADGLHAKLSVVEIPDGVDWTIQEYDGIEWIAEHHRTWS